MTIMQNKYHSLISSIPVRMVYQISIPQKYVVTENPNYIVQDYNRLYLIDFFHIIKIVIII